MATLIEAGATDDTAPRHDKGRVIPLPRKPIHPGVQPVPSKDGKTVSYRAMVRHPITGQRITVNDVLGRKRRTYRTKTEASDACHLADEELSKLIAGGEITVAALRERWLAQEWEKEATRLTYTANSRRFCEQYANKAAGLVSERDWLDFRAQQTKGTTAQLAALKVMFNWAASSDGGRLIDRSPFSGLKVKRPNRKPNVPAREKIEQLIALAYDECPQFGAWLEFACFTGFRPGEIDALRWTDLSDDGLEIDVRRQWAAAAATFTTPKNGREREGVALNSRARGAIDKARRFRRGEHIFCNTQGDHWRPAARNWYWRLIRSKVTWEGKQPHLYLATRHFAAAFMLNALEQRPEHIAFMLGHTDGGGLVRTTYGHPDEKIAGRTIVDAYDEHEKAERAKRKRNLRAIDGGTA